MDKEVKFIVSVNGDNLKELKDTLIQAQKSGADIIEIRRDLINISDDELYSLLKEVKILPFLFTYRSQLEGGKGSNNKDERLKIIDKALKSNLFDFFDLEYHLGEQDLIKPLELNPEKVILSVHYFNGLNNNTKEELEEMAHFNTIVKGAYQIKSQEEFLKFKDIAHELKKLKNPLALLIMGKYAKDSRIFPELLESNYSYSFIDEPKAPGQVNIKEILTKRCADTRTYF